MAEGDSRDRRAATAATAATVETEDPRISGFTVRWRFQNGFLATQRVEVPGGIRGTRVSEVKEVMAAIPAEAAAHFVRAMDAAEVHEGQWGQAGLLARRGREALTASSKEERLTLTILSGYSMRPDPQEVLVSPLLLL